MPLSDQPTPSDNTPPRDLRGYLLLLGPGLAMAATGVGAGDLVAASVAGAKYGYALIWAAAFGALLKYALNEGLARWQLATGQTLLEGWVEHLGRWVQWVFLVYLVLWSFIVAAALMTACGLAGHAIAPALSVNTWAVLHALVAAGFVLWGGYGSFERTVKVFIGVMFVTLLGCALLVEPPLRTVVQVVSQASIPAGGAKFVLSVIGGVGGSLTLLAYGYWIREKGWRGGAWLKAVRVDLGVAYLLTGLFGAAVMVLAAAVLHSQHLEVKGTAGVVKMAEMVAQVAGPVGHWTFLLGFWGAVATSILGVWQGDPYLFCNFVGLMKRLPPDELEAMQSTRSKWYRLYLLWLTFPPMILLTIDKPVAVVVVYTIVGALFMPFLAGTLLYLNSRRDLVGELRSGWGMNLLLVLSLLLFAYLGCSEIVAVFTGG